MQVTTKIKNFIKQSELFVQKEYILTSNKNLSPTEVANFLIESQQKLNQEGYATLNYYYFHNPVFTNDNDLQVAKVGARRVATKEEISQFSLEKNLSQTNRLRASFKSTIDTIECSETKTKMLNLLSSLSNAEVLEAKNFWNMYFQIVIELMQNKLIIEGIQNQLIKTKTKDSLTAQELRDELKLRQQIDDLISSDPIDMIESLMKYGEEIFLLLFINHSLSHIQDQVKNLKKIRIKDRLRAV